MIDQSESVITLCMKRNCMKKIIPIKPFKMIHNWNNSPQPCILASNNKIPNLWHNVWMNTHYNSGCLNIDSSDVLFSDIGARWLTVIIDSLILLERCFSSHTVLYELHVRGYIYLQSGSPCNLVNNRLSLFSHLKCLSKRIIYLRILTIKKQIRSNVSSILSWQVWHFQGTDGVTFSCYRWR